MVFAELLTHLDVSVTISARGHSVASKGVFLAVSYEEMLVGLRVSTASPMMSAAVDVWRFSV